MDFITLSSICLAILFPLIGAFTYKLDRDGKYYRIKFPFSVYIGLLFIGAIPIFNIAIFGLCLIGFTLQSIAYVLDDEEPPIKFFKL